MKTQSSSIQMSVWTMAPAIILAVLMALQGGYFCAPIGLAACAFGILALIRIYSHPINAGRPVAHAALMAGILLLAWCTARPFFDNLESYETLASAARPALAIATLGYWIQLTSEEKRSALTLIAYEGLSFSGLALLMYAGFIPYPGSVMDGRLQFTFQYANVAGIYFATIACLLAVTANGRMKALAALPLACLLMTKSMGALAAGSLVVCATIALRMIKHAKTPSRPRTRQGLAVALLLIFCLVAMAVALQPQRVLSATQTGIERVIQTMDGFRALAAAPLEGIGPQQWRAIFPFVQSAQYSANTIHNSYLGFTLDYGLVGTALLACTIFLFWKYSGSDEDAASRRPILIATPLILHAAMDIDLYFGSIIVLLVILIFAGRTIESGKDEFYAKAPSACKAFRLSALPVLAVASCLLGAYSTYSDIQENKLLALIGETNPAQLVQAISNDRLMLNDRTLRGAVYRTCVLNHQPDAAIALHESAPLLVSGSDAVALAQCFYGTNNAKDAEALLLDAVEKQRFNRSLFENAADLFSSYGISQDGKSRFMQACKAANHAIDTWPATLLSNQEEIPPFTL